MRRTVLRNATLYIRNLLPSVPALAAATRARPKLFSSNEIPPPVPQNPDDVDNKELKRRIESYIKGDEQVLPSIMEAILQRKLSGKHEETDDELMEELRMGPIDDVEDRDFESDFDDCHLTDEEIDDLYNARDVVMKRMVQDEYFNMDDKKWDDIVEDGIKHGFLGDAKECEEILEDMLSWTNSSLVRNPSQFYCSYCLFLCIMQKPKYGDKALGK
ncbi:unnamed protein product [Sphenostylis stenocarpa]|uniref:Uncharacterized protein n=1 Tax=Sphenostylis stenocarpa TaxID=92480 RepID=A0AA86S0Q6_9FABA|nr:unnamed protein product [Sphenostylis stenocarpa]